MYNLIELCSSVDLWTNHAESLNYIRRDKKYILLYCLSHLLNWLIHSIKRFDFNILYICIYINKGSMSKYDFKKLKRFILLALDNAQHVAALIILFDIIN